MTDDELYDLMPHPISAMDATGWLLGDFEIKAAVRFERDNPALDLVAVEGPSHQCPLTNVW